ncbi:glycosyltransferase [[Clostridium] spiroforme]|nr:glycosyltransferase [Thomasclavelia spiroformis]
MKGLFCFDGPLYKDKNGVYCNVTLTDEMFERYFNVVDKLIVMVRTFSSNKTYQELNMKPLTNPNIEVFEVENFNTLKGFIKDKPDFEKVIANIIKDIDLIFARMPSNTSNSVLKIACRYNKPYLVEVGGCAWDSYWNHGIIGKFIAPLMYYEEKKYVKKANFATYVTKYFLQDRYPNKNITTNCSNVYLASVENIVLEQRLKKIKETDLKNIIFGQAVNSIDVKYKGEHLIIRALGILKKKGIHITYEVVGPGSGEYLKQIAKENDVEDQLVLIGTLKKDEMIEWYKSIDIYTQPSKQEGLPRSVIEAMSVGCPAIGSNIAGIPELLDTDCLFNPNKIETIVMTIERILEIKKMQEKAILNFRKAKEYNILDIEKRRQGIFTQYKNMIES